MRKIPRLGICIIAIGKYGREIIKEYENEKNKKIEEEYLIRVFTEYEIDLAKENKDQLYIAIGDFKDSSTQSVIAKLSADKKSKKILLIKNMPFIQEKNIGLIDVSRKKDAIKALEALTFLFMKPGIICIDEADIWSIANSRYLHVKSIRGTKNEVRNKIKKIDRINEVEAILINIVSKNIGLHDVNSIAETLQKECPNNSHILFYYTNAEKMQEGNIEANIIYSLIKSA